ncbi:hypothetical protein CRM22_009924 [Opisthorchis felineus]|uniref:Integrase catalytic domain-containing protein n=1 Tax=Opisthorchis felineus TaxID=147828 RepID=A0A4S2L4B3_OPIFE|nr:hypothetical protein CRM22_009924 [Opisthorchis felineus]
MVGRTNRTLKGLLKAFINHETFEQWDFELLRSLLAYRATIQTSIEQTSSFMTTGREMRIPSNTHLPTPAPEALYSSVFVRRMQAGLVRGHELVRQQLRAAQRCQKEHYDRAVQDRLFNPGDTVWSYETAPPGAIAAKFLRAWKGPYMIEQALSDVAYRLLHPGKPNW